MINVSWMMIGTFLCLCPLSMVLQMRLTMLSPISSWICFGSRINHFKHQIEVIVKNQVIVQEYRPGYLILYTHGSLAAPIWLSFSKLWPSYVSRRHINRKEEECLPWKSGIPLIFTHCCTSSSIIWFLKQSLFLWSWTRYHDLRNLCTVSNSLLLYSRTTGSTTA